ncbi:MAG: RNA polymerase sigma-70 factor [Bacteroidales bacterium]|jgi:RNA polymerase sigma-70 factor (ECF subfamily)|nr:RNA polymerase sigma-70 factor [Bacteroidales bacterium]
MNLSDKQIILKIRKSDLQAYEWLFKEYYQQLCNYAAKFVDENQIAEEIVQDIFFVIWKNRKRLKIKSIKSYLYQAVKNNCLQEIRLNYLSNKYTNYTKEHTNITTSEIDEKIATKELNEIIEKTLNNLPEKCQLIFKMSRYEGLKYREIAEKLTISIKTVEANMGKALKHFRNNLKDYIEFV